MRKQNCIVFRRFTPFNTLITEEVMNLQLFYHFQSMKIADFLWSTNWYRYSAKAKSSIVFIIMRSQKPLKLTVGKFYTMSMQTALSVNANSF